jgi:hypothetical protein
MVKQSAFAVVCAACFLVYPSAAPGRIAEKWNYDRLLKEADLVVLAVAVRTEQADDTPPEHSWPREFVAQNTTLKVRCALKGKVEAEEIKVLHFRFGEFKKGFEGDDIFDGPNFVEFRTGRATVGAGKDKQILPPPEYLLFLKERKDGRYEPVNGQIDPADSIREVSRPLDKVPGSDK